MEIVGQRFGRWLVVCKAWSSGHRAMFVCRCDCGTERPIQGGNLIRGTTNSCGCLRSEMLVAKNAKPDTAFQDLFRSYKKGARVRGLSWELTEEQFRTLTKSPCYFTGREPIKNVYSRRTRDSMKTRDGKGILPGGAYTYNGIDRLDSSKGYTVENSVPCCEDANFAKSDMTYDDFISMCREITEHHKV